MIYKYDEFLNELNTSPMNPYDIWEEFTIVDLFEYRKEVDIKEKKDEFISNVFDDKTVSFYGVDGKHYEEYKVNETRWFNGYMFDTYTGEEHHDNCFFIVNRKGMEFDKNYITKNTIKRGDENQYQTQDNDDTLDPTAEVFTLNDLENIGYSTEMDLNFFFENENVMGINVDMDKPIKIK